MYCWGQLRGVAPYVWQYHLSPDAWRHRFDAVYRLKDGENIRYIKPPFIPERLTYYRTSNPEQAKAIPSGPDNLKLEQDGDQLKWASMEFGGGSKRRSLQEVLKGEVGFRDYELNAPAALLKLNLPGDWTIRKDTPREKLLKALEPVISKATGHKMHFVKQSVERDVTVAHGTMKGDFYGDKHLQIYAEKNSGNSGLGFGDPTNFLGDIGERLGTYMICEAQADNTAGFYFDRYPDSDSTKMGNRREELTDKVLKNITDQTGLTFTHEKRFVDVWFITEEK